MAQKILIMGESGTGKSTSMRNCDPAVTAIVNPVGKPLPFRGKYEMLNGITDEKPIVAWVKDQVKAGKKIIVIDDFQYILSVPYMHRIKEQGWDKWNDFGANYFGLIDMCASLPDDVNVYYMTHTETLDNGVTTIKLIGKLLREKITIEGLFTIVLRTGVNEGKYYFYTQNSGKDTVKSPLGMFETYAIDNDLAYVDAKIRNYYYMDGAKSDEEMKKADEAAAAPDVEKPVKTRRSRTKKEEPVEDAMPKPIADHDIYAKTPGGSVFMIFKGEHYPDDEFTEITEDEYKAATGVQKPGEEVPFEETDRHPDMKVDTAELPQTEEKPLRRHRRVRKEN